MTQEGRAGQGRAGMDRLRQVFFRIRWALGDGGMESEIGKMHGPAMGEVYSPGL